MENDIMTKYLLGRLLKGVISVILVVIIVMFLIYTVMKRDLIFRNDPLYHGKMMNNNKEVYKYEKWEDYGYLDYVAFADWLQEELKNGKITEEEYGNAVVIGDKAEKDSEITSKYVKNFIAKYEAEGYTIVRLDAVYKPGTQKYKDGGNPYLFAHKDISLLKRGWEYFTGFISFDNINKVEDDIGERGLTFTWHDPVYGGEKFSPAVIGNGTQHKYLFYVDSNFPYVHQNIAKIKLGMSYSVNKGIDVFDTMTQSQGSQKMSMVTYPTGLTEESADNLHQATYSPGALESGDPIFNARYTDNYVANANYNHKTGMSKMGYSFVIGIISVIMAYVIALPLGVLMAKKKDKLIDNLGTLYIIFIIAVPSLAYIFMFKAIGGRFGLPTTFDVVKPTWLMYILPIISLALPSIANLMKWLRRYMIDQMNSDYVKFARAGGLSEGEIFSKHILKNAAIPIIHGIPGSVLGSLVGAIITERVYVVPGAGNLLTNAITHYDNGVIVGVTLFYAVLSVVSIILGDILMSMIDPRISFTTKKGR